MTPISYVLHIVYMCINKLLKIIVIVFNYMVYDKLKE